MAKGTRVINVSPMRDDCPDFLNADWIAIRPNTDVALMLALGYEIERRGAADTAFLASHCVGYPQLRAYLLGERDGVAKTPAGQRHYRRPGGAHRRTGAPAYRQTQLYYLFLRGAARASRRTALLDDDRAFGDAGTAELARRRFFLWSRLDEQRRQSAH